MTIVETCAVVLAEIDLYKRRQQDYNDAEKFRKRKDELADLRETLETDLRRLRLLGDKGIPSKPLKFPPSLVSSVEELSVNIESEETGRQNVYAKAKASISKATEVARSGVQATVSSIETPLGAVDEPFLKRLEAIPAMQQRVSEARAKKEEFQRAFQRRLSSPEDLGTFLTKRSELLLIIDQLRNENLPDEVLAFFRAVRTSQATLNHLTPVVRDWLDEHGQLQDVRITMVTK
jgi:DNA repair exonuclease SbcCD ATPase subunit